MSNNFEDYPIDWPQYARGVPSRSVVSLYTDLKDYSQSVVSLYSAWLSS